MRHIHSRHALALAVLLLAVGTDRAAAEQRAVTFDDIMAMRTIVAAGETPVISPDGAWVVYAIRQWEDAGGREGANEPAAAYPSQQTMALFTSRSGITYADNVTAPTLILHGANDRRVPIGQPMEFYRALKDRGKRVELVFYPREPHGLGEYYHQLNRLRRQRDWIVKHTLGDATRKTTTQ